MSSAVTLTSLLSTKNFEGIRFADQFVGGTVTAQIDAALADTSTLLVVVPVTMGAGNATGITTGKALLDLRSGAPKFYTNASTTTPAWQLNDDGTVTGIGWNSATSNPASAGQIRLASADLIKFRNNANSGDVLGLSKDSSNVVQVGDAAGAKTNGPLAVGGAVTGVTSLTASGQITSNVATGTPPLVIASTTVVPNLNVANIGGIAISGTPSTSQVLTATSSSAASWATPSVAGIAGVTYLQQGSAVIASGTASFANICTTQTIPANALTAGSILFFKAELAATNADSTLARTPTFQFVLDGQVVYTANGLSLVSGASTTSWIAEGFLYCTAIGASVIERITGRQALNGAFTVTNTTSITVDTTVSHTVNLQAKWSALPDTASPLTAYCTQIYRLGV